MKTDKELAVEFASAVIQAVSNSSSNSGLAHKPISGNEINRILKDCYQSIKELDDGK